ncbi:MULTISPECIES: hypothetical protein [unclassified Sphingomonas]|uniref:hypothetical protein n=1 Tax=Novosphingobium rhizosphaerae TaxID=1551649 RepID=UPI0015CA29C2
MRTDYAWSESENMIVDGDPLLRQSTECPMVEEPAQTLSETAPSIPISAPPMEETSAETRHAHYCYEALKATAFDAEGRITAIEAWPVVCGPWPRNGGNVSDQPWSGLSLVGDNCTAANEAALRDAAKRSREVVERLHFVGHFQWIRDGYH